MTTRDREDPSPGNGSARRVRPRLERTEPRRSIVNAFYQPDGNGGMRAGGQHFEDDHVWGSRAAPEEPGPDRAGDAPGRLWSDPFEAVRAAYGVVNEQIRAGYEEASRLSNGSEAPEGRRLNRILSRLVQTYSDLGTQWVDLVLATVEDRAGQSDRPTTAAAHGTDMSLAVELTTARPARARALLYRPAQGALSVWPLRRDGGNGEIATASVAPGPVVEIRVAADVPPGLYRGIVIEEGVEEPAGSVIVTIIDEDHG